MWLRTVKRFKWFLFIISVLLFLGFFISIFYPPNYDEKVESIIGTVVFGFIAWRCLKSLKARRQNKNSPADAGVAPVFQQSTDTSENKPNIAREAYKATLADHAISVP
jgi:hypothetical protein